MYLGLKPLGAPENLSTDATPQRLAPKSKAVLFISSVFTFFSYLGVVLPNSLYLNGPMIA
jgi:hypothetical protein